MSIFTLPIKVSKLLFKNYCYLVIDTNNQQAILIDPAWEINKIEQKIESYQVDLTGILLTHHHFDHVNLAESLAQKYQVPVFMSKTEIDYYNFACYNLNSIEQPNSFTLNKINITPIFTPGHTKGAISYWLSDALFSGDTLFIEGCGMCAGNGANPNEMFDSLNLLKSLLPKFTKIYPGHSYGKEPGQTFAYLLENNIYLQFTKREDFVTFRMRKSQTGLFSFL